MNKFVVALALLTFLALMDEVVCRPQDMPQPPNAPPPPDVPQPPTRLSGAGFRRIGEGIRGHQHGANCRGADRSPPQAPAPGAGDAAGQGVNTMNNA